MGTVSGDAYRGYVSIMEVTTGTYYFGRKREKRQWKKRMKSQYPNKTLKFVQIGVSNFHRNYVDAQIRHYSLINKFRRMYIKIVHFVLNKIKS